jgi:hypothetical protein
VAALLGMAAAAAADNGGDSDSGGESDIAVNRIAVDLEAHTRSRRQAAAATNADPQTIKETIYAEFHARKCSERRAFRKARAVRAGVVRRVESALFDLVHDGVSSLTPSRCYCR